MYKPEPEALIWYVQIIQTLTVGTILFSFSSSAFRKAALSIIDIFNPAGYTLSQYDYAGVVKLAQDDFLAQPPEFPPRHVP